MKVNGLLYFLGCVLFFGGLCFFFVAFSGIINTSPTKTSLEVRGLMVDVMTLLIFVSGLGAYLIKNFQQEKE
jgi:hypothetical protein